jgi:hypothetical protein
MPQYIQLTRRSWIWVTCLVDIQGPSSTVNHGRAVIRTIELVHHPQVGKIWNWMYHGNMQCTVTKFTEFICNVILEFLLPVYLTSSPLLYSQHFTTKNYTMTPTIQSSEHAERIQSDSLSLYSSSRPQRLPSPPPKQPSEWDFIDAIMIQGGSPSCSESSQSSSSSDSDDAFSISSVVYEFESFSKFVDNAPSQRDSPPSTEPQEIKLDLPERLDLDALRDAYASAVKDAKIRISLPMANGLVSRLQKQFKSGIRQYLLASSYYAAAPAYDVIFAGRDAADFIVEGMESALDIMLYSFARPGRSVSRSVQELERGLMTRMKSDCARWAAKWVLGKDATKLDGWNLEKAKKGVEENKGVRVLVKKAEECVRDLLGMMIWAHERMKC